MKLKKGERASDSFYTTLIQNMFAKIHKLWKLSEGSMVNEGIVNREEKTFISKLNQIANREEKITDLINRLESKQ